MQVEITGEQEIFNKFFFTVKEAKLHHELYNGAMSAELTRLDFARGDSVAILMHDTNADTIVLTEQFRYPTYQKDDGWLLEIPAGTIEAGETAEDCVRREVREEIGYEVETIKHLSTFYVSPGWTSERILLYYVSVNPENQSAKGGGSVTEGEDIRILVVKISEALLKIDAGELRDAKSIIGLQWLALMKEGNLR